MRIKVILKIFIVLYISSIATAQTIINFDNQGWNSDQSLNSNFTINNFSFSSNQKFYTNYGYNFDVNSTSVYFVFQKKKYDKITITTVNNELASLNSFSFYQVSEQSKDSLIIEGWDDSNKKYSHIFADYSGWKTLKLGYVGINKVVIKLDSMGTGISDFNFDNFSFDQSITTTDTIPPKLISASVINPTSIDLIFSEPLENNSALNKSNYSIDNGITVNSVSISSDSKTVTLNTSQNSANMVYTVVASNIKDTAGNIISPGNNSAQYIYYSDTTPPELSSATILDSVTVELLFSEKIDSSGARNKFNYSISNGINVLNAYLSTNQNKVTLKTTNHVSGQTYTVIVQNILDLAGNKIADKNSAQYYYYIDNTPPVILGVSITNSKSLNVKFSKRLNPNTAGDINNYTISDNVKITNVQIQPDSSSVLVKTAQQQSGREYTLTVSNVKDRAGKLISPNPSSENYNLPVKTTGKGKKNTVQSVTSNDWYYNFSPEKTIDGEGISNPLSRWCSSGVLPDSILYDLGSICSIDSLRISFYQWESGGQYKYSVYASNDLKSWEPIVENVWSDNVEWTEIKFDPIQKRYIKIALLESNLSSPASIWEVEVYGDERISGISAHNVSPQIYELHQNYPNPFNPVTTIEYQLPQAGNVILKVYDILGNEVATLVNSNKSSGSYSVKFNASNLSSGVYIYELRANPSAGSGQSFISRKKMMLLK